MLINVTKPVVKIDNCFQKSSEIPKKLRKTGRRRRENGRLRLGRRGSGGEMKEEKRKKVEVLKIPKQSKKIK